jgi:hypothetical protein
LFILHHSWKDSISWFSFIWQLIQCISPGDLCSV